ncbi:hypothetical protein HY486_00115 [Candidatus Woesearchaeota archaeon]|nr:hypothetical protein [Candidatus Woesearchaeota archaeon]
MLPERTNAEEFRMFLLSQWNVPKELEGKVLLSLDELQRLFPPGNGFDKVKETQVGSNRYHIKYIRPFKCKSAGGLYVGYKCCLCKNVIVGPPDIKTEEMGESALAGREGLDFYCRHCNEPLGELTLKVS